MAILIAFENTHAAIALEKAAQAAQLKARLIGTPESVSASCGLALKTQDEDLATLREMIIDQALLEDVAIYSIVMEGTQKTYQPIDTEAK